MSQPTKKQTAKLDLDVLENLLDEGRPSDALAVLAEVKKKDAAAWFLTGEAQRQLLGPLGGST